MNRIVRCKDCNKDIASQLAEAKDFPKKLQEQVDSHRKKHPKHNSFEERDGA